MAQQIRLIAPEIFTIGGTSVDREKTITFLNEVDLYFRQRKRIILDLSRIKEAYAESTLLLFSAVHSVRCRSKRHNAISIIYPEENSNPDGYARIILSGLKKALEAKNENEILQLVIDGNYYQSGCKETIETLQINTSQMIFQIDGISAEQKIVLLTAISEALLNIQHHAYIGNDYLQRVLRRNRWWQCCWYSPSAHRMVFLIYDAGVGALNSYYPDSDDNAPQEKINKMKELMSKGYSRFNHNGIGKRGKGSEDLKNVIQNFVEEERLTIYTDEVIYSYQYSQGDEKKNCIATSPQCKIKGTLIVWSLILPEKGN
ncbi:hypothetical protein [Haemophilus paraphrohaemolyticus]|uniref:Uncharacterized protein n=1 Tax=Haemophilus paraphrohaemolyticus HK411 TaxID=1095743 RepID=I2NH03_9PAST|nr:hypothetical protein [Haemophilus paraphrohaemolyticus]EIG25114.1 hypothetical protein HMPREF1054_1973 [Haemophilus paraphrohaemolyticus HK411]OOR94257.1 hypothetical protein B0184_08305 [Haemophilus paraphrohaemolyticus]STP01906.1 Uncharacterised protein [Haemophilus paraphrohaemolyticus]